MLNRNFLSGISGLRLTGKIGSMSDAQFSNYINELNHFIDRFPTFEEKLLDAVNAKNYAILIRLLSDVCEILHSIYADDIAREYQGKIGKISAADHSGAEELVENFIQRVSALSIDIQMAAHRNIESPPMKRPAWSSSSQPTILAVDNAIMFLNTLKKLLRNAPYDLHCTTSCAEALEFCANSRPDVILLDIEMPEMNGYDLARKIKNSGQRVPIIFITANSTREYVDKAVEAGGVGLLVKPLRINQLLEKLKEHL